MRLLFPILFVVLQFSGALFAQGAVVEVVDFLPYEEGASVPINMLEGSPFDGMSVGGGGNVGVIPDSDILTIESYWSERRGGSNILPATTGCGPVTLHWSRQVSKSTTVTTNLGLSLGYAKAVSIQGDVQRAYGVTDIVTITTGGDFSLAKNQCGYIFGKEGLNYSEFNIKKNGKIVANGMILFLQDIQIVKNYGILEL